MTPEITIILADDHPIFRQGLRQAIEKEPQFKVLAEAGDGNTALQLIKSYQPLVAVLDLDMPEADGFGVARSVRELGLPTRIIILTMHKDELHVNQAVDLGVAGYLIKDGAVTEVIDCIKTVAKGREYFSPAVSAILLGRSRRATLQVGISDLTPTEKRVLLLLADLKTTKELAAELGVSPRTVDNHRAHICSKLGLQGSHALVKYAIQHKSDLG
jgi:DNA-binding NarL/FixJ family response regulator